MPPQFESFQVNQIFEVYAKDISVQINETASRNLSYFSF